MLRGGCALPVRADAARAPPPRSRSLAAKPASPSDAWQRCSTRLAGLLLSEAPREERAAELHALFSELRGQVVCGNSAARLASVAEQAVADALNTSAVLLRSDVRRREKQLSALVGGHLVLEELRRSGPVPSPSLHRLVIRACARRNNTRLALALLFQALDEGVVFDAEAVTTMLESFASSRAASRGESALQAFTLLERAGARLETKSFNALLRLAPETPAEARWELVQRLLGGLRSRCLPPDSATLEAAVAALGSLRMADEARVLWDDFRAGGCAPCARCWAVLLAAYRDAGQHDRCSALFAQMRSAGLGGVVLNTYHYNIVLDSFVRAGLAAPALALAGEMESEGVAQDQVTRNTLLLATAQLRGPDAAFALRGRRDAVAWAMLVNVCAQAGDPQRAEVTLRAMRAAGFRPDVVACTSLIKAYGSDAEGAVGAYRRMQAAGVAANASTYLTLLRACAAGQAPALASSVYVDMRRAGFAPSSAIFRGLLGAGAVGEWLLESASLDGEEATLDLHGMAAAEARAAVMFVLRELRDRGAAAKRLVIIIGRGGALREEVERVCATLGLPVEGVAGNAGRLLVGGLAAWLRRDRA